MRQRSIVSYLSYPVIIELKMLNKNVGGQARITASGVDVIEGTATPPIAISIGDSQTINISNSSNVQVGDNNSQTIYNGVQAHIKAINESSGSQAEKKEAKSLLKKLLEHPLESAIARGAIGLLR